jgi:glycosyltransferase involved in cell wall biosynthesis
MAESAALRAVIEERDMLRAELRADGVSVVIPCYEQQEYLERSLASATTQTVPPLEVLVIDDGSKEPVHLPLPYGVAGPQRVAPVRIIRVSNRGLPSARNVGLMNARGHAFLPLDADDWLEPTYIEKTLPLLERADVVLTGLQEHGQRTGTYKPGCDLGLRNVTVESQRLSNRLFYASLFRTDLLKACGGYNGRMVHGYEDWDLWIDLYQRGAKIASVDEPLFNYRTRPDSMLAQTEADWKDWNFDEMARHHGYTRPQPAPLSKGQAAREQRNAERMLRNQQRREAMELRRQGRR